MKRLVKVVAFLLLASCSRSPSSSNPSSVIDADAQRWPNPKLIPICFMNREAVDQKIYDDLLNTTVNQFARAGVHFLKWHDCSADEIEQQVIRVKFKVAYDWERSGSYTFGGGMSKVGMVRRGLSNEGSATLWVKLDNKYPDQAGKKRDTITSATRSAFLHEIGHALGLLHEHSRTDYNPDGGECEAGENKPNVSEDPNRVVYVGDPDYDSVMSYCNLTIQKLSVGDIEGIQNLYPELK